MSEKEHAKALLLNDEVIDVALLPIGEAKLISVDQHRAGFQTYDPFMTPVERLEVTMEVRFIGTEEELKGVHHAKRISLIPRD